jgi:hypothetical protein
MAIRLGRQDIRYADMFIRQAFWLAEDLIFV